MSFQQGNSKTTITIHKVQTFHHEVFPSHNTHDLNILYMSQLAQSSTYQRATYNFMKTHHIKIHNITQSKQKQKFQVFNSNTTVTSL